MDTVAHVSAKLQQQVLNLSMSTPRAFRFLNDFGLIVWNDDEALRGLMPGGRLVATFP